MKRRVHAPRGLAAERAGNERIRLRFYGDVEEEELVVEAIELAEALARLEDPGYPTMPPGELEDEPDDVPNYTTAELPVWSPGGVMVLRRIKLPGPDLLEFSTPSGSVYEFPYGQAVRYLRSLLPR